MTMVTHHIYIQYWHSVLNMLQCYFMKIERRTVKRVLMKWVSNFQKGFQECFFYAMGSLAKLEKREINLHLAFSWFDTGSLIICLCCHRIKKLTNARGCRSTRARGRSCTHQVLHARAGQLREDWSYAWLLKRDYLPSYTPNLVMNGVPYSVVHAVPGTVTCTHMFACIPTHNGPMHMHCYSSCN